MNTLELLAGILVVMGALYGWRNGGWLSAILYALGVAAVALVVIFLLSILKAGGI